jgi:hypothetical protein
LPPALVEALDNIGDQIKIEILGPLLNSASSEQLAGTFERLFPTFRDYYISSVLILWGFLREDSQRFSALTVSGFHESERLIRASGPRWIGQDASLNALNGIATVIRVANSATRLVSQDAHVRDAEASSEPWANSLIAYAMAFSSVLAALTDLEGVRANSYRLENVASLAQWSRTYAARAYHFTKELGIIRTSQQHLNPIGGDDEEDAALAGAGLDDYVEMLAREDQL